MIELFGKNHQLGSIVFPVILVCGSVTIILNILYFIKFGSNLINLNMGMGCILFIYSYWNLFVKTNKNSSDLINLRCCIFLIER